MAIELKKTSAFINRCIFKSKPQVLVECDVIVPDKKPDMLKVLQVDATAIISQKEVQQGRVVINGRLDFKILYVPETARGLKGISASAPFTHVEEVKGSAAGMGVSILADVEHIEFMLINSRKIGIKGVVGMEMEVMDKCKVEAVSDIEGSDVQTKNVSINAFNTVVDKEAELVLTERLVVPPGKPPIGSIMKTDIAIRNRDVKVISNKVIVKGELAITTLYSPEGENGVTYMENEMPFTEIIDADGINEDLYTDTIFEIKNAFFHEAPDSDGDMREVEAEVHLSVNIQAGETVSINSIADAYSTSSDLDITRESFEIQEVVDALKMQFNSKEIIGVPSDVPAVAQVYNVIAKPYVSSAAVTGGKITIEGIIDTYILYLSDKDDSPAYSFKHEIPFVQMVDSGAASEDCTAEVRPETSHIGYSINAAGEVEVRVITSCNIKVTRQLSAQVIVDVSEKPITTGKMPSIVIYFVQSGDSMWEIAKRYRTRISDIEEINNIQPRQRLEAGTQLLIPRK